jgi:hypothetical protein
MLTDAQVRAAKPSAAPRKLFDTRGLYLHVMPNGGRYWRFNYRVRGKHKTLALDVYPDVTIAVHDRCRSESSLIVIHCNGWDLDKPVVKKRSMFEYALRSGRAILSPTYSIA